MRDGWLSPVGLAVAWFNGGVAPTVCMSLLFGTDDGVYRASGVRFDEVTRVLDAGRVMRTRRVPSGIYAATLTGLYRSTDAGVTWTDTGVHREEVYSVLEGPSGQRLFAGTHPAHLYVSADAGESWRELAGFQALPSRDSWHTPRHRNEAHVRSLGAHPDAPDRLVAGVEVGGVHVSDDGGETWTERRDGVHDDVHHVLVRTPAEYLASCGDGLYRTRDTGRTWERLRRGLDRRYFRETIVHEGSIYTAAARSSPGHWDGEGGADAALYVGDASAPEFTSMDYPGEPAAVVLSWEAVDGTLLAGTNEGTVLVLESGGWTCSGQVPAGIRSLCAV